MEKLSGGIFGKGVWQQDGITSNEMVHFAGGNAERGTGRVLERFQSSRVFSEITGGGFYFHPSDEDLSVGPRI
jgi:hypothetical protein